jgi:DNA repair protein SbcC/Rad50
MSAEYPLPVEGFELLSAEASNEQIQELIGLSFQIFTNTIVFAQNTRGKSVTDFLDEDDAGQKEIFSTLFHLSGYEQARDLVIPDLKKTKTQLEDTQRNLSDISIKMEAERHTFANLTTSKEEFERTKVSSIKEREDSVRRLTGELRDCDPEKKTQEFLALSLKVEQEEKKLESLRNEEKEAQDVLTRLLTKLELNEKSLATHQRITFSTTLSRPVKPDFDLEKGEAEKVELEESIKILKQDKKDKEELKKDWDEAFRNANKIASTRSKQLKDAEDNQKQIDKQRETLIAKIDGITVCPACRQEFVTEESKSNALKDLIRQLESLRDLDVKAIKEWSDLSIQEVKDLEDNRFNQAKYDETVSAIFQLEGELGTVKANIELQRAYEKDALLYASHLKQIEKSKEDNKASIALLEKEIADICTDADLKQKEFVLAELARKAQEERAGKNQAALHTLHAKLEAEIMPLQKQLNDAIASLQTATESLFPQEGWLTKTQENLVVLEENETNLKEGCKLLKAEVQLLDDLSEAFSKEGIISELFREYLPDIEELAQEYLTELTNNELGIKFSAEKELKKKVKGVTELRNQFEIEVEKKNGGSAYDLISGSEQNKAALVVNWALSDLAYRHSNVSCNIRSYDEIFDGLDAKSTERLSNLLLTKFQDENIITFVVTHKQELDDSFPYKIVLRKEDGVSRIEQILE